jgi:small subunit ribosomal protein S5
MTETTTSFVDTVVSVRRVTKVTKGGKRFSFSAFVVSGDQKGQVGIGLAKSREVASAIAKATVRARKNLIRFSLRSTTLPYDMLGQHGATSVMLRPASKGTGLIAGGAVRAVMIGLGVKDVLTKVVGPSRCGLNVVKATMNALAQARSLSEVSQLRGRTMTQVLKGCHEAQ